MVDVVRLVDLIQMMLLLQVTQAFIVASHVPIYGKNDATDLGVLRIFPSPLQPVKLLPNMLASIDLYAPNLDVLHSLLA